MKRSVSFRTREAGINHLMYLPLKRIPSPPPPPPVEVVIVEYLNDFKKLDATVGHIVSRANEVMKSMPLFLFYFFLSVNFSIANALTDYQSCRGKCICRAKYTYIYTLQHNSSLYIEPRIMRERRKSKTTSRR